MSPEAAREERARRIEAIEGGYELMLGYAAKGFATDEGADNSGQLRDHLKRFDAALTGLAEFYRKFAEVTGHGPAGAIDGFLAVLARDAADTQAALRMVISQKGISSQLVDNLNASIHVRALLTDVFLIDELVK